METWDTIRARRDVASGHSAVVDQEQAQRVLGCPDGYRAMFPIGPAASGSATRLLSPLKDERQQAAGSEQQDQPRREPPSRALSGGAPEPWNERDCNGEEE